MGEACDINRSRVLAAKFPPLQPQIQSDRLSGRRTPRPDRQRNQKRLTFQIDFVHDMHNLSHVGTDIRYGLPFVMRP
jgi:hypothetical protein